MDNETIQKHFARMGARVRVAQFDRRDDLRRRRSTAVSTGSGLSLDIGRDRRGEFFDIRADFGNVTMDVVDIRPADRHLLLMARIRESDRKDKFLCGHDERFWFVAAVPPQRGVSSVRTAMEALKPEAVLREQARRGVKSKHRSRRKTAAYVRQGEWFFVPCPEKRADPARVIRNEPLRRGTGKPHMAQEVFRQGGWNVYVSRQSNLQLSEQEYRRFLQDNPSAKNWAWQVLRATTEVYVRGAVRHPDHAMIYLPFWHQVYMNTEWQAPALRHVTFID